MAPHHRFVILDTCAFLRRAPLHPEQGEYLTTPSVVRELTDTQARAYFEHSPVPIRVQSPSADALEKIIQMATLTGDRASLSATDLHVLALTLDMEKLAKGSWDHLRSTPVQPMVQTGAQRSRSFDSTTTSNDKLEGWFTPKSTIKRSPTEDQNDLCESMNELALDANGNATLSEEPEVKELETIPEEPEAEVLETIVEEQEDVDQHDDDEDDGWITPGKLKQKNNQQNVNLMSSFDEDSVLVACMTDDFAMQNVLMHLGSHVVSVEGLLIKQLKTWVLRCHACYHVTKDSLKKFCPKCGNNTLIRTSTSMTPDGQWILHLKKNFQYKLRGTKYSIPETQSGRTAQNLILREDQKEYVRAMKQQKYKKADADIDDLPALLTGQRSQRHQTAVIGHGRRNPNEVRRTGKRK